MYALIQNGIVAELFTPPAGFTLAQCFHADIAAQFVAVPSGITPAQGWTYANGTFAAPPAPAAPTLAQQAAAAMLAGITITSTGTPAISGLYGCDDGMQGKLDRVSNYIKVNGVFPAKLSAMPWPDMSGTVHEFPTTDAFQAFASAVGSYVVELDAVIMGVAAQGSLGGSQGNGSGGVAAALPPATATIP